LLGNNEIIVFGGTGNFTYSVDVSSVVLGEQQPSGKKGQPAVLARVKKYAEA